MTRRKHDRRQVEAALRFWEASLKPFKEHFDENTQDRRTTADVAACPQRQGEEAGDGEDRSEPAHLGKGE